MAVWIETKGEREAVKEGRMRGRIPAASMEPKKAGRSLDVKGSCQDDVAGGAGEREGQHRP